MRLRGMKQRALTLVELMVAVAIVILMVTVVGINLRGAAATQRFHDSVQRIVNKLRYAQDLMIIANTDAEVVFDREDNKTYCQLRLVGDVSALLRQAAGKREELPEIDWLQWEGADDWNGSAVEQDGKVVIGFLALGRKISRGWLDLANVRSSQGGLRRFIALPGYPAHLQSSVEPPNLGKLDEQHLQQSAELYPYAIHEARKIQEAK